MIFFAVLFFASYGAAADSRKATPAAAAAPADSEASYFGSHVRATQEYKAYLAANPKITAEQRQQKFSEFFAESNKLYQKDIRAMRKELLGAFIQGAAKPQGSKMPDKKDLAKKGSSEKGGPASDKKGIIAVSKTGNRSAGTPSVRNRGATDPVNAGGADAVSFKGQGADTISYKGQDADDDEAVDFSADKAPAKAAGKNAAPSKAVESVGGADAVKFQ